MQIKIVEFLSQNKIICILLSLAIICIFLSLNFNKKITVKKSKRLVLMTKTSKINKLVEGIPILRARRDVLKKDIALLTQKSNKSNEKIATNIIVIMIISSITIALICFIFIKYWILKILIPIFIVGISVYLFKFKLNRRRRMAQRDFAIVIKKFTSSYAAEQNNIKAMQKCVKEIPDSHKYEFNMLISSMGSYEEYIKALDEYAERIDYDMCYVFVETLKNGYVSNKNMLVSLINIENYVTSYLAQDKNTRNKLNDKKLNIGLGILCIVGAVILNIILLGEYATYFYFSTFVGQLIIVLSAIAIISVLILVSVVNKLL